MLGDETLLYEGPTGPLNLGSLGSGYDAIYRGDTTTIPDTGAGGAVAYLLDGSGDGLTVDGINFGSGGAASVIAWVKLASKPSFAGIFVENRGVNPAAHIVQIDYRGDATDKFRAIMFDGINVNIANSSVSPTVSQWHLVVAAYNGSTIGISVDGGSFVSVASARNDLAWTTIGAGWHPSYSRDFPGRMDGIAVVDYAVDETLAAAIFAAGRPSTGGVMEAQSSGVPLS